MDKAYYSITVGCNQQNRYDVLDYTDKDTIETRDEKQGTPIVFMKKENALKKVQELIQNEVIKQTKHERVEIHRWIKGECVGGTSYNAKGKLRWEYGQARKTTTIQALV